MESFEDRKRKFNKEYDDTQRFAKGLMVFAAIMGALIVLTCIGAVIVGLVVAL